MAETERDEDWRESRLWRALEAMRIEPPGASLGFVERLARENRWSQAFARQVFAEYKRFLLLAAEAHGAVTPSDAVDQAWHLHLTYTRHYWDVLCGTILGRPLHHLPTEGGTVEGARFRMQYEGTLARYRSTFGTEPPPQIWPDAETRFSERSVRIDPGRYWLVPKAVRGPVLAAGVAALAAACSTAGGSGGGDAAFWLLLVTAVAVSLVMGRALVRDARERRAERKDDGGSCGGFFGSFGDSDSGGGGGSGGCGGD